MKHDLIIIGGGAAGLIAAITAKDLGIDVAIMEGTDRIGKKILTTGNGRCNITNINTSPRMYHSNNHSFYEPALKAFGYIDTENFFTSLGLPLVSLEDGKLYPMSLQASAVLDIFRLTLIEKAIPIYLSTKAKEVLPLKEGFKIYTCCDQVFEAKKIILSTGGVSAPKTGSDGSGYSIAKQLGHKLITPLPALVQLKLSFKNLKALAGIKFQGTAEVFANGNSLRKEVGEILFTDYGISGPPILQLSRTAAYALKLKNKVIIKIDLMNTFSSESLVDFFENHWATFSYRSVHDSLIGILNKKLIPILLKESGLVSIHKPCSDLEWEEKKNILTLLKEWEFEITATNSFNDAQITAGGIDSAFIIPETLESKLIPNLYFAGEIIDVDGDCGGFNLQWAWSSGYVAAKNVAVSK
ncbi:MAG: NAD(P)/FAD-dependent oxidoreductase [Clostridiaceae bacterium]|nr:NAD(P)/FAD-dependent oxidoreductase [Clostridiaceae bacterium]